MKARILLFVICFFVEIRLFSQNINLGLVAYYPLDGNTNDVSGMGNNGTNHGATISLDRFAQPGKAFFFDGASSFISIPYSSSIDFSPSGQFSISVWLKPDIAKLNLYGAVIVKSAYEPSFPNSKWDYGLYTTASNKFMTGYAYTNFLNSATNITTLDCWYHVIVTYNNGRWNMYVNGELESKDYSQTYRILQSAAGISIGKRGEANGDYYAGAVDELRIYNRELSASDVKMLYDVPIIHPSLNSSFNCIGTISVPNVSTNKYLWSTGAKDNSITVTESGKYWVKTTAGCQTAFDTIDVIVNKPRLPALIKSRDTVLCGAQSIQLKAAGGFLSYEWSPSNSLNKADISNPVAIPTATTTYIVKVIADDPCGVNLISNGDFSAGNASFYSEYSLEAINKTEETYFVNSDPRQWNPGSGPCFDHTSGNGNQMNVNGGQIAGVKVWCQNITVNPNTEYAFSSYVQSLNNISPAILQFSINDQLLGSSFKAPPTPCLWQRFYATWNSGANTTANICIVNQNLEKFGNDFTLDDISFLSYKLLTDTITVHYKGVTSKPHVTNTTDCNTRTTSFNVTNTSSIAWNFGDTVFCQGQNTLLSDISMGTPVIWSNGTLGAMAVVSTPGMLTATRIENGCLAADTVNIKVLQSPLLNIAAENIFCPDEGIANLIAVSDADTVYWYNQNILIGNGKTFKTIIDGLYKVMAQKNGCTSEALTRLTNICEPKLFIPTAFTPNADGTNDTLQFFHSNVKDFQIRIFSRWGEVVYNSKDVIKGWDGIYLGEPLPGGVYNYRAHYAGAGTVKNELWGEITIVR